MSFITAIGTATPPHRFRQSDIAAFMVRAMRLNLNGDARKLRAVFRASGIDYRYSVLADYGKTRDFTFYADTEDLEPFPGTEKRLHAFRQHAAPVSAAAVEDMLMMRGPFDLREVTHLIVVCCTGMYAPGLDIDLVKALNLSLTVERTAINFMGCQAAFNALKVADAICGNNPDAKVLIVCTEFCSLHFQRKPTDDNLLANALFGDGSAAVLVEGRTSSALQLRMERFRTALALAGMDDMAWTIGDAGFEMRLSAYIPELVGAGVGDLVTSLLNAASLDIAGIRYFAIHPGGKRIIEAVQTQLGIPPGSTSCAYEVLRNYGNMSSPTVLFVLQKLVRQLDASARGERILALAFGPGLTMESMILSIDHTL